MTRDCAIWTLRPPTSRGSVAYLQSIVSEHHLTQQTAGALSRAEESARRLQHGIVDTQHVLLGILQEETSLASRVLSGMGLDAATVERHVQQRFREYVPPEDGHTLHYSDDVELALQLAEREAQWMGHESVGTEHLLIGLLRGQEGGAVRLLSELGVTPGHVWRNVRQLLQAAQLELGFESARHMTSLSELGRRLLNGAISEAATAGHASVGVEHLLLAFCRDQRNVAGRVLREMGMDSEYLGWLVTRLTFPKPLAPVFDAAVMEARRLGDHYVGTDHLMLALTRDGSGMGVLRFVGLDPGAVRSHLTALMSN